MDGNGFFRRLVALCRKEFVQLWRDSSSLLIGTVLPRYWRTPPPRRRTR